MLIIKEEKELLASGDEEAFSRLFYQYVPILKPFITRFTHSPDITEEIIQEIFIRIWLSREKLENVDNIQSWLFRFASNECLNYLRRQLLENKVKHEASHDYQSEDHTTAEYLGLNELRHLLDEAISQLPPQRQRIYRMSRVQGMKMDEIAGALDISPNTVKNTLVTSLKFIRNYLALFGYVFSMLMGTFLYYNFMFDSLFKPVVFLILYTS